MAWKVVYNGEQIPGTIDNEAKSNATNSLSKMANGVFTIRVEDDGDVRDLVVTPGVPVYFVHANEDGQ